MLTVSPFSNGICNYTYVMYNYTADTYILSFITVRYSMPVFQSCGPCTKAEIPRSRHRPGCEQPHTGGGGRLRKEVPLEVNRKDEAPEAKKEGEAMAGGTNSKYSGTEV